MIFFLAIQSLDELTAETNNSTAIRMDKHIKLMKDLQNLNSNAHTTAETKRRDRRNTALMGVLHPQG